MIAECVAATILEAIGQANRQYEQWTGGDWLIDAATEALIQAAVAKAVFEAAGGGTVVVEATCRKLYIDSSLKMPYRRLDDLAQFDVVVRDSNKNPIYIIELKKEWNTTNALGDIQRIDELHTNWGEANGGSLKGGFYGFFLGTSLTPRPCYLDTRKKYVLEGVKGVLADLSYDHTITFGGICAAPYSGYSKAGRQREGCAACIQLTTRKG